MYTGNNENAWKKTVAALNEIGSKILTDAPPADEQLQLYKDAMLKDEDVFNCITMVGLTGIAASIMEAVMTDTDTPKNNCNN